MDTNYKKSRIDELYVEYADDFGMWTKHLDDMSSSELPFEIEDWMYDYAIEKQMENVINEGDLVVTRLGLVEGNYYGEMLYINDMELIEPTEVEDINHIWLAVKGKSGYLYSVQMLNKVK